MERCRASCALRAIAGAVILLATTGVPACGGAQHAPPAAGLDPQDQARVAATCGEGAAVTSAPRAGLSGAPGSASLTPGERVALATGIVAQICEAAQGVGRELHEARTQRDTAKELCLSDKLAQITVAGRSAQDRKGALDAAVSQKDGALSDHEFAILTVLRQRVEQLVAESHQCIGEAPPPAFVTTTIYYATDRIPTDVSGVYGRFGHDRSRLTFGSYQVAIPHDHELGELETHTWWKVQFHDSPGRDVTLLAASPRSKSDFLEDVAARRRADGNRTFVFVHGFNVSFDDAARRTAQLAYDLAFPGAPVLFSWPSYGEVQDYTWDKESARWSGHDLADVLESLRASAPDQEITLLVHSMGNEAMAAAVAQIAASTPTVREVILAAPDLDAEIFMRDVAPALKRVSARTTLYASSKDEALVASKKVNGAWRAGDSGSALVIAPGVETVDVSGVDAGLLGHSYYGDNRSVLSDVFAIIRNHVPPDQRFGLHAADRGGGKYWVFDPSAR
jgi:esterase/lipase superfamily enzyme